MLNYLRKIDPYVFEELLLSSFERKGYKIIRGKRYSGDGGIDGEIYNKDGKLCIIQAKRYSGYVKKEHIEEFISIVSKRNANGYFIHTGKTGQNIFRLAKENNINIVSGTKLINLLEK